MAKLDLNALKPSIMSISATAARSKRQSEELRSLSRQRREAAQQIVRQTLAEAGIDIAALQEKLSENDRSFRDAAQRLQRPESETLAKRKIAFQNNIAERRAAFGPLGNLTDLRSSMVYLPEPIIAFISPNSSLPFLKGTSIAPYDSRIKFFVPSTEYDGQLNCEFWFYWFNDGAFQVMVTDVSSQIVCNGHVFAYVSSPPFFFGLFEIPEISFGSGASVTLYGQGASVAENSGASAGEAFDLTARWSDAQRDLSFEYETLNATVLGRPSIVPPQTGVLIRVAAYFGWQYTNQEQDDEGEAGNTFWADFANDELDYFVQCSGVALELLTQVVTEPG